ncbi:hypothetical protein [Cupriavidus gilardii]|uniref:hypothetical protein n=1 Tax=Cupriavidus gilardii TaxID=82541 RepID=UPI001EE5A5F6|nr:hypothetical protein [Cupriavidus gilardii]MCG5259146.1 hypothetical protein [Cupriavidus gilardii]
MLRSATFVRSLQRLLRLSLLPLLLALLPLHGWAGAGLPAGTSAAQGIESAAIIDAIEVIDSIDSAVASATAASPSAIGDASPDCGAPTPSPFAEAGEAAPSGADLAEQLLLPSAPAMTDAGGRIGPPAYAALRLPEPDLPLLPRPPRG